MKAILFLLMATLLCSCFEMFNEKKDLILTCKLDAKSTFEVYSIGYGATTKGHTEVRKTFNSGSDIVKRIDGDYNGYKAEIFRVNDTLFRIKFTDTSVFKGMSKSFIFSINDRERQ